jgi:hypothetical protein
MRRAAAAGFVALVTFVGLALVPVFFAPGTQWPAVTIIAILGFAALLGVAWPRTARAAVAGVTSFLGGIGLFVVFALVALNYYDEQPRPWWLLSLFTIAVGLIAGGILAVLLAALASLRGSHTPHQRTG